MEAGAWRGSTLLNGCEHTAMAAKRVHNQFCKSGARDDRAAGGAQHEPVECDAHAGPRLRQNFSF